MKKVVFLLASLLPLFTLAEYNDLGVKIDMRQISINTGKGVCANHLKDALRKKFGMDFRMKSSNMDNWFHNGNVKSEKPLIIQYKGSHAEKDNGQEIFYTCIYEDEIMKKTIKIVSY